MNENTNALDFAGNDMSQLPLLWYGYSNGLHAFQNILERHDILNCYHASVYVVSFALAIALLVSAVKSLKNAF